MNKFNTTSKCPKCGLIGEALYFNDTNRVLYNKGIIETRHMVKWFVEFLRRTCGRCGYSWPEACLDNSSTLYGKVL